MRYESLRKNLLNRVHCSNIDEEEAGIAVYDSSKDDYTTGDLVQVKAPE